MKRFEFDERTRAVLEGLKTPLAVYQFINNRVVTILLSDGFCELFGYTDKAQAYYDMDNDMYKYTHPDDAARAASEAYTFATKGGAFDSIYRTLSHDDTRQGYFIIHSKGEHVYTEDGTRLAYVWYTDEGSYNCDSSTVESDLNNDFRMALHEESIIKQSYYDALTGLPNMRYFFSLAEDWRATHLAEGGSMAMLFADLCGMKYFNRRFGFAEGNTLLISFASLLKKHFSNENCARFGSDHFCVFTDAKDIEKTLISIYHEFEKLNDGKILPIRVGICIDSDGSVEVSRLCDRAKIACDSMRDSHISRYAFFTDEMYRKAMNKAYIISNLDKALAEGWIKVYYQPIVRAANGRVCDEEALARWIDPEKGVIMPLEFIHVLEEAKLINKLDLYVTEQVLKKIKKQQEAGLYVVGGSVNFSRVDFDVCDIVEEVRKRVDAAGVERSKFNIEVTESTVGNDFEYMKSQIERFQKLGFKVWMDDFGSGYSTLDVLQSIHFDLIKFDIRFMKEFATNYKSKIILTELIRMAVSLGIDTVCEGVETEEQADFLREVGCTKLQGFHYCHPIPLDKILERYKNGMQIGFENPDESDYYSAIGKINLYDLAVMANEDKVAFRHYFNTLPMAVLEVDDKGIALTRCNMTYRAFTKNVVHANLRPKLMYDDEDYNRDSEILNAVRDCADNGGKRIVDEKFAGGTCAHVFVKRVAVNPIKKNKAVVVVVLAIADDYIGTQEVV